MLMLPLRLSFFDTSTHRIFFYALCAVLTLTAAACSGRHGGVSTLPAPSTANDFMRSITPQSVSPGAVAIPPMQGLTGIRPALSLRRPQTEINALTFTQLQGSAAYVAASPDGTFWVLSTQGLPNGDKYIYHYVNGSFVNVPGAASRIAIGPDDTAWVVNAAGGIYHLVNGVFTGIAGAASEISVGGSVSAPLVDVISNQSAGPYGAAIYQYNVNAGTWSQLPGAGVTIATSIDPGTYPALDINPGGFYLTNQVGGIYYYNPGVGFEQLPGGAIRLAPTANGGIFALGDPTNPVQHGIYYNDLNTGAWTQMPGAAVSISANSQDVYAIGAAGGIYQSPITSPGIFADASQPGPPMTRDQIGTNLQVAVVEATSPTYASLFKNIGVGSVRWPGGTGSDYYHWQTNTMGPCTSLSAWSGNTFANFMTSMIQAGSFDLNVTVNYGTNATCTAGGDPSEAAAWVNYANNVQHYGVKHWTVGNEQYYSNATDLNTSHDPLTYASRVANLFYPQMKAMDPTISVGVDIAQGSTGTIPNWDNIVLANAKYDFVEMHFYPEYGPNDSDIFLTQQAPAILATDFASAKAELAAAGKSATPIYLGEFDGSGEFPFTKQELSITNALFIGMVLGEVTNAGISMATVWDGVEICGSGGNASPTLYGWQSFGSSGVFSQAGDNTTCAADGVPAMTAFPKARALQLASLYVVPGERPLPVSNGATLIRAYGATQGSGYAFMLFNLDQNNSTVQTVGVRNTTRTTFSATTTTYGKAQYDESQNGVWAGPVSASLGTVSNPFSITLPPWSMTVVQLK